MKIAPPAPSAPPPDPLLKPCARPFLRVRPINDRPLPAFTSNRRNGALVVSRAIVMPRARPVWPSIVIDLLALMKNALGPNCVPVCALL